MAVTIDVGEWNDIHPLNKKDVGRRLALVSTAGSYTVIQAWLTPDLSIRKWQSKGRRIIITFSNTGSGLVVKGGGKSQAFRNCRPDMKFVWAKARIRGDKVIVKGKKNKESCCCQICLG